VISKHISSGLLLGPFVEPANDQLEFYGSSFPVIEQIASLIRFAVNLI